ncbi:MAG: aspartate--ammonia ligase [Marinifilaceae bacterium]
METLFIPKDYKSKLDVWETERAIQLIKESFQTALASELKLRRITAPLVVASGTGLNDNLNGTEAPVSFATKALDGQKAEVVQSLAKWKRYALWRHHILPGMGIYTDMNALRPDEVVDNLHSLYVDQWDWEKVMHASDRSTDYLQDTVEQIYAALKRTEFIVSEAYPVLQPFLPDTIHFIHAEELRRMYPDLSPKMRENQITKAYGAVFIQGIGGELGDGTIHDDRSPDYDDWSTPVTDELNGLNGDLLIWHPILEIAFELSSMGIRVDKEAMDRQLTIRNAEDRKELLFHKLLLNGDLPQTIGGGIGQSRLCMLLLQKCHVGEVQSGIWPEEMLTKCKEAGIFIF